MPKPREYDREQVLDRAMRVFWEHGYTATGIGDLEQAMGINRSSLYHAFGDKEGLFREVLRHYEHVVVDEVLSDLEHGADGIAAVQRLFDRLLAYQGTATECRGCLMNGTANESNQHSNSINEAVAAHLERFEAAFRSALQRARDAGEIPADVPIRDRARLLTAITQGLLVMAKTSPDPAALESITTSAMATIHGS